MCHQGALSARALGRAREGNNIAMAESHDRALGSLELLQEHATRTFALTALGELLYRDQPHTLRGMASLAGGPEH